MGTEQIESTLSACERALTGDEPVNLAERGFWRAVEAVKRRPEWVERYGDRIATIDRRAFERSRLVKVAPFLGTAILAIGSMVGLLLVGAAPVAPRRWRGLSLLAGTGVLLGTTHGLAHLLVGKAIGLRFTHWFLSGPTRIQPSLKVDYASYLRTPPVARAWMHASGALVTKVIPFAVLPVALTTRAPRWVTATLVGIGLAQIGTDLLYSGQHSDWKRFRREMRVARHVRARAT